MSREGEDWGWLRVESGLQILNTCWFSLYNVEILPNSSFLVSLFTALWNVEIAKHGEGVFIESNRRWGFDYDRFDTCNFEESLWTNKF